MELGIDEGISDGLDVGIIDGTLLKTIVGAGLIVGAYTGNASNISSGSIRNEKSKLWMFGQTLSISESLIPIQLAMPLNTVSQGVVGINRPIW